MKYVAPRKGVTMIIAAAAITALLAVTISTVKSDNIPVFTSRSDARAFYCEQILKHTKQIQFTYVTDNSNTSQVCKFFNDDAFADEGSNFSLMGDYLRYSLFDGYKANCNYLKKDKKALLYFQVPNILQDVQGSRKKKFELQLRSTLDSLKLEKKE